MDILSAVDGTGPYSDEEYAQDFSKSFVHSMYVNWHTPYRYYDRGPALDGLSTGDKAKTMAGAAEIMYSSQVDPRSAGKARLFLTGYSRGGAAALEAANILCAKGIPVFALLLFDAVDRSVTITQTTVPLGVQYCRHAVRGDNTKSRESFGNVGLQKHVSVDYPHAAAFHCTHGAMGGVPWKEAGPDNFIYEQRGGEPAPTMPSAADLAMGLGSAAGKFVAKKIYNYATRTNVTLAQETKGVDDVRRYMFGELDKLVKMPHAGV